VVSAPVMVSTRLIVARYPCHAGSALACPGRTRRACGRMDSFDQINLVHPTQVLARSVDRHRRAAADAEGTDDELGIILPLAGQRELAPLVVDRACEAQRAGIAADGRVPRVPAPLVEQDAVERAAAIADGGKGDAGIAAD